MQRLRWNIGALDLVNFFLADVRGAFGPYLGVFLVTQQQWNQAAVGLIATMGGLAGLAVHAPWGALINAAQCKRALLVTGLTVHGSDRARAGRHGGRGVAQLFRGDDGTDRYGRGGAR